MEYKKITEQIKGCEKEYEQKLKQAKKAYDELIEKNFYSMRDKIVEITKDLSEDEFGEWLSRAKDDESIEPKLYALVQLSYYEAHEMPERDVPGDGEISIDDLAATLALLHLIRRSL